MKTAGIFAFAMILFFSVNLFGQTKSGISAKFDSQKSALKTEDKMIVTNFLVKATDQQIADIKLTAKKFAQFTTVTISDTKDSDGNYKFNIKSKPQLNTEGDKNFLLKLFYDFNIETFNYNGSNYAIDKFPGTVK